MTVWPRYYKTFVVIHYVVFKWLFCISSHLDLVSAGFSEWFKDLAPYEFSFLFSPVYSIYVAFDIRDILHWNLFTPAVFSVHKLSVAAMYISKQSDLVSISKCKVSFKKISRSLFDIPRQMEASYSLTILTLTNFLVNHYSLEWKESFVPRNWIRTTHLFCVTRKRNNLRANSFLLIPVFTSAIIFALLSLITIITYIYCNQYFCGSLHVCLLFSRK